MRPRSRCLPTVAANRKHFLFNCTPWIVEMKSDARVFLGYGRSCSVDPVWMATALLAVTISFQVKE